MVDHQAHGKRLADAMRKEQAARVDAHRSSERLAQAEAARALHDRVFDASDASHVDRRRVLDAEQAALRTSLADHRATVRKLAAEVVTNRGAFEPFSDPRTGFDGFDDRVPTLLFPIRLETRFKEIAEPAGVRHQLWVRVYPDDCLVDTFESTMSEDELANIRDFWIAWARAGGITDDQRGAWRVLAGDFGSGRAGWLIDQYRPVDLAALPIKTDPDVVYLVIPTEQLLSATEAAATVVYWTAIWAAGHDGAAQAAADATLRAEVGDVRAEEIITEYRPDDDGRQSDPNAVVEIVFLEFPPAADVPTQRLPWSRPAVVDALPERFVLLAYRGGTEVVNELGALIPSPLPAGPDPLADQADQIHQDGADLDFGDLDWMADFDEAVRVGMGFRVDLDATDVAQGFDQLLVLGVRLCADRNEGQDIVETLFTRHRDGTAGLSLLPTGAVTNNTEEAGSGYGASDDPDDTFDLVLGGLQPLSRVADRTARSDGQWLADTLGVDLATFDRTANARGTSMCEARAMNTALWPATWGYAMESMMGPVFNDSIVESTRWFFTQFVSGRGLVPSIRIGDQPYGILPTTAFSRSIWLERGEWSTPPDPSQPDGSRSYLAGLSGVLNRMRADWATMADDVAVVGKPGDPHQILLDIVGLSPASVEYHRRWAESLEELANRLKLSGLAGSLVTILIGLAYTESGNQLLAKLGHRGDTPEVLEKFFFQTAKKIDGDLVDDRPLSEVDPIRQWTPAGDNYIEWLIDAANTSFERLRKEEGFTDDAAPRSLLYLLLRYALEQGYWDAGLRVLGESGALSKSDLLTARIDPSFVHVTEKPEVATAVPAATTTGDDNTAFSGKPVHFDRPSESRYEYLYRQAPGRPDLHVAELIPSIIGTTRSGRYLDDQLRALAHLRDAPTARLERAMAEHLDLGRYRLDAWRWGLLHYELAVLREGPVDSTGVPELQTGVYVGAFGWLEDVQKKTEKRTPIVLSPELETQFNPAGMQAAMVDSNNEGYIHAPSLNHAVAAAILRNGYISSATEQSPDELAVNLTSARVRAALSVIEGLRNGQSLGALLGYRFERGLHDRHGVAEVDRFIYAIRREFPLVANRLKDTAAPNEPIEAIEARNVIDGLALAKHIRDGGSPNYPFGRTSLPAASGSQSDAIDAEVERLLDVQDAVADLATSEAVYQAVLGNYERTSASLDAYSDGSQLPEPEVIRTPRSGITITHRLAVQFEAGRNATVSPNSLAVTARTLAEPAANAWLNGVLPPPATVGCLVDFVDATGTPRTVPVTQADLGLQPLDLVHTLETELDQAMADLDDRIEEHVLRTSALRPDTTVLIRYRSAPSGSLSFFEVAALVESLRGLVLRSRPLTADDAALSDEASREPATSGTIDAVRVDTPRDRLEAVVDAGVGNDDLTKLAADLAGPLGDTDANLATIVAQAESWAERFVTQARRAAEFGIEQAAFGFVADGRRRAYAAALSALDTLLDRWQTSLTDYANSVTDALALPTPTDQFDALRRAERLVTTIFDSTVHATPAAYATALNGRRDLLTAKRATFAAIRQNPGPTVTGLLAAIETELPIDTFDDEQLDLSASKSALVALGRDVAAMTTTLGLEVERRVSAATAASTAASTSAEPASALEHRTAAAHALFGDSFVIAAEYSLSQDRGDELENAFGDRDRLLRNLTAPPPAGLGLDFPVDDWLHGVARVREKAALWEHVVVSADALETGEPDLTPIQLPFKADDFWLGLQFPETYESDGEHLAYTAHYAVPFDKTRPQCGLLLDEWTEVIPTVEETTGVAFHFDQPNSEPPQTMLLATSPTLTGTWRWNDLVDAVRETFDEARLRAVEPTQVDKTPYSRFLPAALMSTTLHPINIGLNLAFTANVTTFLSGEQDG